MSLWKKLFGDKEYEVNELLKAATDGNLRKVKSLLKRNHDLVFSKDQDGRTALHEAAWGGRTEVAKLLLANKAEVDAKICGILWKGWTPLHCAANGVYGTKDVAELLLAHGADVNSKNWEGWTPLHAAVDRGHKDVADLLLANGAELNVHDAASGGYLARVQALLKENLDLVFSKDHEGRTPLHCVDRHNKAMVELLLANKADVNAKDKTGRTPLVAREPAGEVSYFVSVVEEGNLEKVKALLKDNLDLAFSFGGICGWTPLHYAAARGHKDVAELLLASGALVNISCGGYTPLHCANTCEVAKLLLDHGADVKAKDREGRTPLHHVVDRGHRDVADLLLSNGAEFNVHDAALGGYLAKVQALLNENPGLVFSKDYEGRTPLHCAATKGHKDVAELLLTNNADVNARDRLGWTPLHVAADKGYKNIAELLLANKAEVNAMDIHGRTPLVWVTEEKVQKDKGHKDVAELLRQHRREELEARDRTPQDLAQTTMKQTQRLTEPTSGRSNLGGKQSGDGSRLNTKGNADDPLRAESNGLLTVLLAAVGRRDHAAVNSLIAAGVNVNETNNKGVTALMVAADSGNIECLKALIAAGANLNAKDNDEGATALHVAAYKGYVECVKALIAAGANLDAKDNRGLTPLFSAGVGGSADVEAVLRDAGARASAISDLQPTAIHEAVAGGDFATAKALLRRDPNLVFKKDNHGRTSLHFAASVGRRNMAELLLANRADVNAKNSDGLTPLMLANEYGRKDVAELLRQHGGQE